MLRALVGLAIRLPAVAERRQQSLHAAGADLVALLLQRDGHLVVAFRHPQQRPHRIAERGRLDDAAQVLDQRRVPARQMPPAATLAAYPAFRQRRSAEVFLSPPDGRARAPLDLGDPLQTAPSCRTDLAGCEHPPPALIELRANGLPSLPNRLRVDHADLHTAAAPSQESRRPESQHHMALRRNPIHLLRRMSLGEAGCWRPRLLGPEPPPRCAVYEVGVSSLVGAAACSAAGGCSATGSEREIDAFAAEPNGGLIFLPPEAIRG